MDNSFNPIEKMIHTLAKRHDNYPLREVLLTRLQIHIQNKLLENRNKMLKTHQLNDTLFHALMTLEACENQRLQPSELSLALGSSRTNATRIGDELARRGWVERSESSHDRRCLTLCLTDEGHRFISQLLQPHHKSLQMIWNILSEDEQLQLEGLFRKILGRLDEIEAKEKNS